MQMRNANMAKMMRRAITEMTMSTASDDDDEEELRGVANKVTTDAATESNENEKMKKSTPKILESEMRSGARYSE